MTKLYLFYVSNYSTKNFSENCLQLSKMESEIDENSIMETVLQLLKEYIQLLSDQGSPETKDLIEEGN